jgi:hypothetical protein
MIGYLSMSALLYRHLEFASLVHPQIVVPNWGLKSGSQIGVSNQGPKLESQIGVSNWGPFGRHPIAPNQGPPIVAVLTHAVG